MQRIRIERKPSRRRADPDPLLPLDPRDPDILRAKELQRLRSRSGLEAPRRRWA
jgi:hypothetical protein